MKENTGAQTIAIPTGQAFVKREIIFILLYGLRREFEPGFPASAAAQIRGGPSAISGLTATDEEA